MAGSGQITSWGSASARPEFYTAVNTGAVAVSPGQPVAHDVAGTGVILGQATGIATACVGIAEDAMAALVGAGQIRTDGKITLADWTAATGGAALVAGSTYYLGLITAGTLVTPAPAAGVGQLVQEVGYAASATELILEIAPPIVM